MNDRQLSDWKLVYTQWRPEQQSLRESLCTLGNGYFATRGAAEEADVGGAHYPGTYLAGGYNRLESEVAGRVIENEDLVNWPNWLCLTFRPAGSPWIDISSAELLSFQQTLDLRRGLLERELRIRDANERVTLLSSRRLVHMSEPHLAAIEWTLVPENWSGTIEIRSGLDGSVTNSGVARYRKLASQHLEILEMGRITEDGILLSVQTNQSHIRMTQAARTQVFTFDQPAAIQRQTIQSEVKIEQHLVLEVEKEKPVRIEKVVALYTSRDVAVSEPSAAARNAISRAACFEQLLNTHCLAWKHIWNHADIEIGDSDDYAQLVLRLHVFHLLQTASPNSIDLDAGIPARGWHGEAYRGHIFWDELFIFPFLNLRIPWLTRSLLMYRYRRLAEARHLARQAGYAGAMFPWQSGSSGREESQVVHLNPRSGRWIPDHTYRQRHINGAVAYNVWQYYQATADIEFLSFYGSKMLLEIARFWASIATFNGERQRYEIHGVVGPDEFHTQPSGTASPGLSNNAYTNLIAAWSVKCALRALDLLGKDRHDELVEELGLTDDELVRWSDLTRKMFIPFHGDGIISQFEGYEQLQEFPWSEYQEKYGDIARLDRILEAEGKSVDQYKVSKQADVVMLFHLFSAEELRELFQGLGYAFAPEWIPRNIEYYMQRTSHGSTLSRIVHSWVLARSDRERAWQLFHDALSSDIDDVQGGTTPEGIHLGAMAGTVDLMQRCHTGIEMREDILWFNPCLPGNLREVRLRIRYRGHWLRVCVTPDELNITSEKSWSPPIQIGFGGKVFHMQQADQLRFDLRGLP